MDADERLKIELRNLAKLEDEYIKARERYETQKNRVDRLAKEAGKIIVSKG